MDAATIKRLAQRLDQAESSRTQVRQLSLEHPDITIADAYAIQREWVAAEARIREARKNITDPRSTQAADLEQVAREKADLSGRR